MRPGSTGRRYQPDPDSRTKYTGRNPGLAGCSTYTNHPTYAKLDWKRLGLCKVLRRVSPDAYELELPASRRIHRDQPISLWDPVIEDPLIGQRIEPPPPVEMDGEEE